MNDIRRLIAAKRDGRRLDTREWDDVVTDYVAGRTPEAEVAALLMACVLRGIDVEETAALTGAMIASGEILRFPSSPVVDKHSSGGVGDTVSLLAVPLAAACGVRVAKLAGRALGHTGGTIDKLEALPGVTTVLAPERFVEIVERVGCAVAAQSEKLVPADRMLYALRDRTATVESPGLIAASIVSKKIAAGADAIVYDVKCGSGAFMHDEAAARVLGEMIAGVTRVFGKRCTVLITDMDVPLGTTIGSGLEALEAIALLGGRTAAGSRLAELAIEIADEMCLLAGVEPKAAAMLASGAGVSKLLEMLEAQGGEIERFASLAPCDPVTTVSAQGAGYVQAIDGAALGELARDLCAQSGPFAGIELLIERGSRVERGAALARVYGDRCDVAAVADAFTLGERQVPSRPLVLGRIAQSEAGTV